MLTNVDDNASSSSMATVNGLASIDSAIKTLHKAEERVRNVISQRFDEAVMHEDLASIERFFKLFIKF